MKFGWSADTSTAAIDIATLYAQQNNENLSLVTLASYFLHVACVSLATASTINTESLPSLLHHTDDIVVSEELAEELEMLEAIYPPQHLTWVRCCAFVLDGENEGLTTWYSFLFSSEGSEEVVLAILTSFLMTH